MEKRYMTVSEFAEKHGVPYQSAVRWARRGHIPGVKITQFGKFKIYMIPEDAEPPELPTGRPPLTDEEKAARAEQSATTAKRVRKSGARKASKKKGGAAK
jgi:hypothetical protein